MIWETHLWVPDPPWSECMKCEKCGAETSYANIRSDGALYGKPEKCNA
jgi:hypothetical protein